MKERVSVGGRDCLLWGTPGEGPVLIQPMDARMLDSAAKEAAHIEGLAGHLPFLLAAFSVGCWNDDLSPWPGPPVFGSAAFGGGAAHTLNWIHDALLPELPAGHNTVFIGGYSLAGLFALWAAYACGSFQGTAAVSPSVWYPGWLEYAAARKPRASRIYLSLGDAEARTRNPVMARVGDAIRTQHNLLAGQADCVLVWNPGNHFREPELRTAKGFAWLLTPPDGPAPERSPRQ